MPPRLIRRLAALFLLLLLSACAHTGPETWLKPPPPDYGKIAIIVPACAGFELDTPSRGWLGGMGRGSARWIGKSLGAGLQSGDGYIGAAIIFLSPVFGIAGGVHGAVVAEPAWEVDACEEAIRQAVPGLDFRQALEDDMLDRAFSRPELSCVPLLDESREYLACTDYRPLCEEGIDTVVEARVLYCGLEGEWAHNPGLALTMKVRVQLIRTADGKVISTRDYSDNGEKRTFCDWAGNTAMLKTEMEDRASKISKWIVEELGWGFL